MESRLSKMVNEARRGFGQRVGKGATCYVLYILSDMKGLTLISWQAKSLDHKMVGLPAQCHAPGLDFSFLYSDWLEHLLIFLLNPMSTCLTKNWHWFSPVTSRWSLHFRYISNASEVRFLSLLSYKKHLTQDHFKVSHFHLFHLVFNVQNQQTSHVALTQPQYHLRYLPH